MESRAHGVWASAEGGPRSSIHLHVLFLWAMTHSASPDWFLFSLRISSPPDSNKSKELKFGTCCVLILAKCVWKLFPVWLPFNRYVSMTPDYTEDRKTIWGRVLSKTTLKEGRKEEERKGKHDAKGRIFFFGEEIPPDCILFFFLKVLWEDIQNAPWFEMSAFLNFRNLVLGTLWTLQGRSRPWIRPQHIETDSQVPDSP